MSIRLCAGCLSWLLLASGCLDTLSVGLSTSAVLDAGSDDELDASEEDASSRDAGARDAGALDTSVAATDAGDAASDDAGDAGAEVPEECPIARCAVAGILTPDTTPRCSDGGVALCLREPDNMCGWSCEVVP